MSREARYAERKALLVARAQVERLQLELTVRALQDRVALPRAGDGRTGPPSRLAALIVALGLPALGRSRLSRWMRWGSVGLAIYRIVRQWR